MLGTTPTIYSLSTCHRKLVQACDLSVKIQMHGSDLISSPV